ncbi:MAG: sulfatase-like hydrolase/transferase, partial [Holophagales bacterium]|nr:sulfatase-like hydrolase/transferase [Holophagales bacterium]
HLWDPHFTYAAPEPWTLAFDPDFDGVFDLYDRVSRGERTWGQVFFESDLNPRQVEHAIARYDGEILYADRMLEVFLDALRAAGRYDDALIVFTSDHGESLGEHDLHFEHGEYLYDTTLRIPLVVKFPGGRHAGRRISDPASILDILPTLLATAGIEHGEVDGMDLAALIETAAGEGRLLFAQSGRNFVEQNPRREVAGLAGYWTSIRQRNLKLIHIPMRDGSHFELYDIDADPGETENLYRPGEAGVERLRKALLAWRARLLVSKAEAEPPDVEPRELERLRALGYVN